MTTSDEPYPEKFEQPDHMPQPYLTAIGQVVVNWCLLESVVDLALGKLSAFDINDPRGVIVTTHLSWPQKMNALETLVDVMKKDYAHLEPKFAKLKPLLTEAQKGRNQIIHGQWAERDGTVYKANISARGKLKFAFEPIALDRIKTIADKIGEAGLATIKLIVDK